MSSSVSHAPYEIVAWPARAITPDVLYLQVGGSDRITAAAAAMAGGWRVVLFEDDTAQVGACVGDEDVAREWLEAIGRAAVA